MRAREASSHPRSALRADPARGLRARSRGLPARSRAHAHQDPSQAFGFPARPARRGTGHRPSPVCRSSRVRGPGERQTPSPGTAVAAHTVLELVFPLHRLSHFKTVQHERTASRKETGSSNTVSPRAQHSGGVRRGRSAPGAGLASGAISRSFPASALPSERGGPRSLPPAPLHRGAARVWAAWPRVVGLGLVRRRPAASDVRLPRLPLQRRGAPRSTPDRPESVHLGPGEAAERLQGLRGTNQGTSTLATQWPVFRRPFQQRRLLTCV